MAVFWIVVRFNYYKIMCSYEKLMNILTDPFLVFMIPFIFFLINYYLRFKTYIYILGSARHTDGIYFTCDLCYYFLYNFVVCVLSSQLQVICMRYIILLI